MNILTTNHLIQVIKLKEIKKLNMFYRLLQARSNKEYIQAILELLEEEDIEIRLRGIKALRRMRKKYVRSVIPNLDKAMILEKNEGIKFEMAFTLMMIEGVEGNAMKEINRMKEKGKLTDQQKEKIERQIRHQKKGLKMEN